MCLLYLDLESVNKDNIYMNRCQGRKIVHVVKQCNDTNDRRGGCVITMSELYFSHSALHYITALNFALYID